MRSLIGRGLGAPLPQCWLGVSVEDQKTADTRIPLLLQTPAAVRFLSCEPLLAPVDLQPWLWKTAAMPLDHLLHWVIAGAESGPGARPMEERWVKDLKDQCVAAGMPFFLKQFADVKGRKIHTPVLDGRQWVEYPR